MGEKLQIYSTEQNMESAPGWTDIDQDPSSKQPLTWYKVSTRTNWTLYELIYKIITLQSTISLLLMID